MDVFFDEFLYGPVRKKRMDRFEETDPEHIQFYKKWFLITTLSTGCDSKPVIDPGDRYICFPTNFFMDRFAKRVDRFTKTDP